MNAVRGVRSAIVGGLLGSLASAANAGTCSLCREVLSSSGNTNLIQGYYLSIVLLVGISSAVLAVVVRYAWKSYR